MKIEKMMKMIPWPSENAGSVVQLAHWSSAEEHVNIWELENCGPLSEDNIGWCMIWYDMYVGAYRNLNGQNGPEWQRRRLFRMVKGRARRAPPATEATTITFWEMPRKSVRSMWAIFFSSRAADFPLERKDWSTSHRRCNITRMDLWRTAWFWKWMSHCNETYGNLWLWKRIKRVEFFQDFRPQFV